MVVNVEFLGEEPIENVITSLNFKIDKTVFFGYSEIIDKQKKTTERCLKKYCGVSQVAFHPLSHTDLQSVLKVMRKEIGYEKGQGNQIYFDITGGEILILVAFGILSKEMETPMHMYDVEKGSLVELDEGAKRSISAEVKKQTVEFDLDRHIELWGGVVNYRLHKGIMELEGQDAELWVERLWKVSSRYRGKWNSFSNFLKKHAPLPGTLEVRLSAGTVLDDLQELKALNPAWLNQMLDTCAEEGILRGIRHADGVYTYTYTSETVKDCLWDAGKILELHTFMQMQKDAKDCKTGVHIDWDGVIHEQAGVDVVNEIDVLALHGYVPTFVSCKNGKMNKIQSLHALYELQTIAERFGGKYAKKILVVPQGLSSDIDMVRAKEMKIEIR